jgi:hypothetical protein
MTVTEKDLGIPVLSLSRVPSGTLVRCRGSSRMTDTSVWVLSALGPNQTVPE